MSLLCVLNRVSSCPLYLCPEHRQKHMTWPSLLVAKKNHEQEESGNEIPAVSF